MNKTVSVVAAGIVNTLTPSKAPEESLVVVCLSYLGERVPNAQNPNLPLCLRSFTDRWHRKRRNLVVCGAANRQGQIQSP
jgi:hypothetical protein